MIVRRRRRQRTAGLQRQCRLCRRTQPRAVCHGSTTTAAALLRSRRGPPARRQPPVSSAPKKSPTSWFVLGNACIAVVHRPHRTHSTRRTYPTRPFVHPCSRCMVGRLPSAPLPCAPHHLSIGTCSWRWCRSRSAPACWPSCRSPCPTTWQCPRPSPRSCSGCMPRSALSSRPRTAPA